MSFLLCLFIVLVVFHFGFEGTEDLGSDCAVPGHCLPFTSYMYTLFVWVIYYVVCSSAHTDGHFLVFHCPSGCPLSVLSSNPGFSSLADETFNRGPVSI